MACYSFSLNELRNLHVHIICYNKTIKNNINAAHWIKVCKPVNLDHSHQLM